MSTSLGAGNSPGAAGQSARTSPDAAASGLVGGADLAVVAGQLGRTPHAMSRVMARCLFGYPAAVEDLPYDSAGTPFPTLFYLTCPTYVAAVAALESAGGVRYWTRRLAAEPALERSLAAAVAATRRRRQDLARRCPAQPRDGGRSLALGVGGAADRDAVKCLHAHVAHALAHPRYAFGRAVANSAVNPWCDDHRCAAFVPAYGAEAAP